MKVLTEHGRNIANQEIAALKADRDKYLKMYKSMNKITYKTMAGAKQKRINILQAKVDYSNENFDNLIAQDRQAKAEKRAFKKLLKGKSPSELLDIAQQLIKKM